MTNDITFSLAQVVWLIGGITAIAAFIAWVAKPFKQIEDHERRLETLEKAVDAQKTTDRYVTKALNAIVNHMIDGNGIDKLKEVRDEFQDNIINH